MTENKAIKIPKIYFKKEGSGYVFSNKKENGMNLHPAFLDKQGLERDYYLHVESEV